jgi:FkbM family methyltransferase
MESVMQKELVLAGTPVVVSAQDGDFYLATMPALGPTDLEAVFRAFCRTGDDVIDVGANIGITAILAAEIVDPGIVLALEPLPTTFEHLEQNVIASGLGNIRCLPFAAAAAPGNVTLVSRPGYGFAAYVGTAEAPEYEESVVRALTIDQVVDDQTLANARFMKIDVEGYELEVLRGATRLLKASEPVVLLESNHYCLNVFRRMSLPDFVTEIKAIFPFVFALDFSPGLSILDLTNSETLPGFFHDSIVNNRYPNLLCGFAPETNETLGQICDYTANLRSRTVPDRPSPGAGNKVAEDSQGSSAVLSMAVSTRERDLLLLKRQVFERLRRRGRYFGRT